MVVKGKWRKNPVHVGSGGRPKCPICNLVGGGNKYWNGKEFVIYETGKPCPRCGYINKKSGS
jgi:hypothetical protein